MRTSSRSQAMEYFFDRELPRTRGRKYESQRIALAALVITIGWLAAAQAENGALPREGGSIDAAGSPAAQSVQNDPHVDAGASPKSPDVTVTAPTLPTDQELAGHSLEEFILHHATTHYVKPSTTGNLTRWRGGR